MGSAALPVLPLRDVVVFPGQAATLVVGRARSVSAVADAARTGGPVLLLPQRRSDVEHPAPADLHGVGTVARVVQVLRLADGNCRVQLEGVRRGRVTAFGAHPDHLVAHVETPVEPGADDPEVEARLAAVRAAVERYVKLDRAAPPSLLLGVHAVDDPSRLADLVAAALAAALDERQALLATLDVAARLDRVHRLLLAEIEFHQLDRKLRARRDPGRPDVRLDEDPPPDRDELDGVRRALDARSLPDAVRRRAERELTRLGQMSPLSSEAAVVRGWLDWILALPWGDRAEPCTDLGEAAAVLDDAHHGLVEVKDRVLEHLAVATLAAGAPGPILCLVGPPGVGKTSLARSIARAAGRPFARVALGGVRDEAEIRGHRRTYVGALPGRIVQALKRAGASNALVLLDELDKLGADHRGDPAAALLEVLDPEQNTAFADHYLDVDVDLSAVMFVGTANTLAGIPRALLDRLEVVEVPGYTDAEKRAIARRHLLPKALAHAGLAASQLTVDDAAIDRIATAWARESGVRELDRQLRRITRRVARRVVEQGPAVHVHVGADDVEAWLGPARHAPVPREAGDVVGVVNALSVSPTGGELLQVEVAAVPGQGTLTTTGRPGEVLKESAAAAFTYVRSRARALGLDPSFHVEHDFHVHYPGVPGVEGPSAGIAMATALVSALTGLPVRRDTALTGEISLRGRVLPVGGVREKVLAADRAGLTRVLVPEPNRDDLATVPDDVRARLEIVLVGHMDRVLAEALVGLPAATTIRDSEESGYDVDRGPESRALAAHRARNP